MPGRGRCQHHLQLNRDTAERGPRPLTRLPNHVLIAYTRPRPPELGSKEGCDPPDASRVSNTDRDAVPGCWFGAAVISTLVAAVWRSIVWRGSHRPDATKHAHDFPDRLERRHPHLRGSRN